MRRPIILPAIFFALGIIIQFYINLPIKIIVILGILGILFCRKIPYLIWIVLGIAILFFHTNSMIPMENDVDSEVKISGVCRYVTKGESLYGKEQYDFIFYADNGAKIDVTYYGSLKEGEKIDGRRAEISGTLEKPQVRRNPGSFDYSLYLKSKGIAYQMKTESIIPAEERYAGYADKILGQLHILRNNFSEDLYKVMEKENAAVMKAMMFGLKDDMSDEIYYEFQKNGTAHILAVSGLHMGIIYAVIAVVFSAGRRKLPNIIVIILLFFYSAMADFAPSIMRAFIMITVGVFGKLLHKRYDLWSAGAFSAMILLMQNPYNLFNGGFQMSFLAIFIMAASLSRFSNFNIKPWIKNTLLPAFLIQMVMAPYICYNFNYFSISSFIANIPVTLISTWLMPIGLAALVMSMISGEIYLFYGKFMDIMTEVMLKANSYTYADGKMTFDVVSPSIFLLLLFYGIFFIILNEDVIILILRKNIKKVAVLLICAICFSAGIWMANRDGFEDADVMFIDVGQGNCMLFKSDDGKNILIDAGGNLNYDTGLKTVKPVLLKNGIKKIDVALVTHLDNDHYLGIKSLGKDGMIKQFATYEGNVVIQEKLAKECGIDKEDIIFLKRGDMLSLGEDIRIQVIAPEGKTIGEYKEEYEKTDENERSLVMKVIKDEISFLITGDINTDTENSLKGDISADILQVAHHGSKHSSGDEFIKKVSPKIAVIQVGKNNYGHPAPEVIEKYENKCIMITRNDTQGAVGFVISGDKVRMVTVIDEKTHEQMKKKLRK